MSTEVLKYIVRLPEILHLLVQMKLGFVAPIAGIAKV